MAEMTPEQQAELRKKLESMSPEELKEFQKKQCIFCHMVSGKVAVKKIYEDDKVLGVLDINPANPGHVLLLPKEHHMIMPQLPEDELQHIFKISKQLSNTVLRALDVRGTNIIVANGPAAGQRAQHFMVHIIPRKEKDGLEFSLPSHQYAEEQLEQTAQVVKQKLNALLGIDEKPVPKLVDDEFKPKEEPDEESDEDADDEDADDSEDDDSDEEKTDDETDEDDSDEGDDSDEKDSGLDLDAIGRLVNG